MPTGGRRKALAPAGGTARTLLAFYRQAVGTATRELARWRAAGVAAGAGSVKAAVYDRNAGSGAR